MVAQGVPSQTPVAVSSSAAAATPGASSGNVEGIGGDGLPEKPSPSTREAMSTCALTLLRVLSHATKYHLDSSSSSSSGGDSGTDGVGTTAEHVNGQSNSNSSNDDSNRHYSSRRGGVPDTIIAVTGSCLSRVAQAIDLAAAPQGAMESVLTLLLPSAGLLVREQAALAIGAIAGEAFRVLADSRPTRSTSAVADEVSHVVDSLNDAAGEDEPKGKRILLWRRFCAGVIGGMGAQVIVEGRGEGVGAFNALVGCDAEEVS